MHAVLVSVSVDADVMESAQATLREQVVPTGRQRTSVDFRAVMANA